MANFCNKCGAPSDGGPFCGRCGAAMMKGPAAQPQAVAQTPAPIQPLAATPSAVPSPSPTTPVAAGKGSPLIKIVIAVVAVLFLFGAVAIGGVYYVVYRVKEKVQEVKAEVIGSSSSAPDTSSESSSNSDACRLLSKEDVGHAIGVEIVATEANDGGCSYLAEGNSADMTAKHAALMVKGADAKTQQTLQSFASGIFKATQSENPKDKPDVDGKVPVVSFSIDTNSVDTQMKLNENVLGRLGPPEPPIEGIGDHAFDAAGGMMMVRKGDKLIRITYIMCPCSTDAIKPLAKKLADRL
jgi:hypothetical protein